MIAHKRATAHSAILRELARNLERLLTSPAGQVCLANRGGQPSCSCYRDAHHAGSHRCLCGTEWPSK